MKHTLIIIILSMWTLAFGQEISVPDQLTITEQTMTLDKTERPGFKIQLSADPKDISKKFDAYVKLNQKWDLKTKSGVLTHMDVFNPSFSDKHFNAYAYCATNGEECELRLFISYGTDIYINTNDYPTEAGKMEDILRKFAQNYYTNYVNEFVIEKNKQLKNETKNLAGVKKKIGSSSKTVATSQTKIEKLDKNQVKATEKIRKIQEAIDKDVASSEGLKNAIEDEEKVLETLKVDEEKINVEIKKTTADLEILNQKLEKIKNY